MPASQENFHKKILGKHGETAAVSYLKRKRYKILEKNLRIGNAEADIVALDKGTYVFVEVKTRTTDFYGRPAEAVTFQKQRKYRQFALAYLSGRGLDDVPVRFDVIEIFMGEINHIENAF